VKGPTAKVVVVGGALLGGLACWALWRPGESGWQWLVLPWLYLVAGLIAWARQPGNPTGRLLVFTGIAYSLFLFEGTKIPLLWTIGVAFELAFVPALFALLLSFPSGRLSRPWERRAVLAAVVAMVCWTTIPTLAVDPGDLGCQSCPPNLNLVKQGPETVALLHDIYSDFPSRVYFMIAMFAGLAVVCLVRWWRASRPLRRISGPVVVAAVPFYWP
jgi:hypothetical protein